MFSFRGGKKNTKAPPQMADVAVAGFHGLFHYQHLADG